MRFRSFALYAFILAAVLVSCKRNRLNINVSGIEADVKITRFDKSLFSVSSENFKQDVLKLRNTCTDFFDLFTSRMINIGVVDDSMFFGELKKFVTDTMILNVRKQVENNFSDFSGLKKQIDNAFVHYRYYFPAKKIPDLYTCISGFNQSIVIAENLIGISLDKYLGPDYPYYERLGIPKYDRLKMYKARLPVDVMYGWATGEFPKSSNESNVLSYMIYEGKLLYFIDAMFPKMQDSLKIGFTGKQLDWCKTNEARMWTILVENKRIYSTERMDVKRLIDNSPYTNGFPLESPGRAGVWIGWQIVRQYMDKHPEVTLPQLMALDDSQKILNDSKYFPE